MSSLIATGLTSGVVSAFVALSVDFFLKPTVEARQERARKQRAKQEDLREQIIRCALDFERSSIVEVQDRTGGQRFRDICARVRKLDEATRLTNWRAPKPLRMLLSYELGKATVLLDIVENIHFPATPEFKLASDYLVKGKLSGTRVMEDLRGSFWLPSNYLRVETWDLKARWRIRRQATKRYAQLRMNEDKSASSTAG